MKPRYLYLMILAVLLGSLLILNETTSAQTFGARWGGGVALGTNSIYGDLKKTGYGISGEGYLTWRLNTRLGITGSLGYGVLPFTFPRNLGGAIIPANSKANTNIIRGDLRLDYELTSTNVRPYIGAGISGFNSQTTVKIAGATFKSKRFNDIGFGFGGGMRFMINPRIALDLGGNFRYTTSDNFDGLRGKKANDAIIAITTGFTFFGGSSGSDLYVEQAPVEETFSDDLLDFQDRIDQMETAPQQQPQDMQEYVRLKSKMDELNQQIGQKEGEITTLRANLDEKKENVDVMQSQLASTPAASAPPSASFSRAYEEALSKFYGKRYNEAIADFNLLIAQFPDHSLVSNCVYWIGESYFGAGKYRDAADAFSKVLSYPRSLKKDDALLMLGRAYLQLSQKEEAREAFNRLIREFPASEFVAKAEEWINRM